MLGFHPVWALILLVVILIIFGVGKLPQIGGALGRSIKEFRKSVSEDDEAKPAETSSDGKGG